MNSGTFSGGPYADDTFHGVRILSAEEAQMMLRNGLPHHFYPFSRFLTFSTVWSHLSYAMVFHTTTALRIMIFRVLIHSACCDIFRCPILSWCLRTFTLLWMLRYLVLLSVPSLQATTSCSSACASLWCGLPLFTNRAVGGLDPYRICCPYWIGQAKTAETKTFTPPKFWSVWIAVFSIKKVNPQQKTNTLMIFSFSEGITTNR